MSEKIIDEVMGLIEEFARASEGFPDYYTWEDVVSAKNDIRAKLREVLERKPLSDVDVQIEANNEDDFDWNDLGHKKTWHEGFIAGFRAAECTHKIGAE